MNTPLHDNGSGRLGIERRQLPYNPLILERRFGKDRRSGLDRRLKPRTSE